MADETKKTTTTPKKRTTTSKPKVEEPKPTSIEEQMAQMMAMMMAQQQQIMELMKNQQVAETQEEVEEVKKPQPKRQRNNEGKMTKQDLRRKYKDTDIYLTNITQGIVNYKGRNMMYHWENTGDSEVVTIDDIVNMPKKYLNTPWLIIDGYENSEEVIDDIKEVLKLEKVYEYVDTIQDLHEDINSVTVEDIERVIELSKKRGYDITLDLVVLIQRKIDSKELTNFHVIGELQKILGRKFL